ASGYNITLFSLPNRDRSIAGKTFDILNETCSNIPDSFLEIDGGISGVWSNSPCVILFEVFRRAFRILFSANSGVQLDKLGDINFDNRARSAGPCE
ncbi:hypothetical protein PMAYCL1PPCAC_09686, partial [Pristionchus mayeri]